MICFRCNKEIKEEEDYYKMIEVSKKREVRTDYVHKTCWDNFIKQLDGATATLDKSNYLLNAIGGSMKRMGLIPEQEVEIQC